MTICNDSKKVESLNYTAVIQAPFGKLGISARPFLTKIEFLEDDVPLVDTINQPIIGQIIQELNHYFKNPNFQFTIPYQTTGTPFQAGMEYFSLFTHWQNHHLW